ncbi:hypothetical protein MUY27_05230 [Mucilaginibacter sp. RS28]|uniref:Uncharacterized protein n=1 Tax=Mucilaginibacter straminoryzae TaxID=2932774 RepID=A0A9X2B8W8_9SPHI|nr:hypothetical protein [Mucilaginibacter straminoryzae]MCJ8209100.1 hypothetical protein [Mucilaginibacter straminoryzae]
MGNKTTGSFERIKNLKEQFQHLSSEKLAKRLLNFRESNDISIAYKQILKERGIDDYLIYLDSLENN